MEAGRPESASLLSKRLRLGQSQEASGLVLTVLGERLVQPVILEETTDSRYSPIDGKQRLASLLSFLNGERLWEHAPVELVVSNDDDDEDAWFHGKTYKDLGKEWQRRFGNYTLHCVIITNDTDPDVIFKIYDDLNSGGRDHTKQQIRKAAFHGSYMSLLEDLIKTPDFKEVWGGDPDDKKEVDRELVLRYFAMKNGGDDFKGSLTKWLNSEAKQRRNADTAAFSRDFSTTLSVARAIFGNSAFRHPGVDTVKKAKASSKGPTSNIHPYLWDTIMVVLSDALKMQGRPRLQQRGDAIKAAYQQLWQNPQWLDAMEKRLSAASIMLRRDLFKAHILPPDGFVDQQGARAFHPSLRRELFAADPTCAHCGNSIQHIDDAEVDHAVPYSKGGATTRDNARLLHKTCNKSIGNRGGSGGSAAGGISGSGAGRRGGQGVGGGDEVVTAGG